MQLSFDFRETATRRAILNALLESMDAQQRAEYDGLLAKAAVPEKHHHNIGEVNETIAALEVPQQVKESLRGVYDILAHAEAKVHGCDVSQTHFHEVGRGSGIRNALAICAAFHVLAPTEVVATAVQPGLGEVECAHGVLSLPAPATAAILEGLPLAEPRLEGERCTPTSAAIIRYFVTRFES